METLDSVDNLLHKALIHGHTVNSDIAGIFHYYEQDKHVGIVH